MKQPVVASVIEFPKLIMMNTNIILAAFAITFLASLPPSSAYAKHNLDIPNTFDKHLDHELQPFLREKREKEAEMFHLRNNNPLELEEEPLEPKSIYERRTLGEEAKDIKKSEEQEKLSIDPKTNNDVAEEEEDAQDDVFSYRNMHDLIQALILADEEDIAERLQQLRKNTTKSERFNNLPKRQAVASAAAAAAATASNGLLGANPWDVVPLIDLDAHSCEVEAFSHGHLHLSGTIVHEFFCELRKFWHYGLIVLRNLRSGLSLGPLIDGDIVSDNILGHLFHHTSHLLHIVIREPHHLLILPDIIHDAVPFPSIIGAIHRLKQVFFKVLHFGIDLFRTHVRHIFVHLFSHLRLGLREKLLGSFSSVLPLEEIIAEPIVSTAASAVSTAAASAAAATATATAATSSDSSIIVPDYQTSLAELLSSFRGFYHGYYASGVPHLIKTGVSGISLPSVFSGISSYLSRTPFCNGPIEQSTTVTTSSTSSSVAIGSGPVVSPVIEPIVPIAPVVPIETAKIASSSTATATVAETQPVFSALIQPEVIPSVLEGNVAAASAAAASSATNVVSTPVVGQVPLTLPLRKYRPSLSTIAPAAAAASASASASTGGRTNQISTSFASLTRRGSASSAIASTSSASSSAVASSSAISSDAFNIVLPREQIVGALGYDYLLPGDIISVTLKNKAILFGRVLDATSPITFSFLRPKIRASLLRHGGRIWKLLPRHFRNPECYRKFNDPLLLRYGL
ncbi:hypothetical protein ALC60_09246 [Trachymyrmex zeteki]|uniref:Uncharacterized protein n=1 Tax=Mycetomoellerius zeteki TaxID=64791 RepID=A0A151WV04_9HYME|nr:hypothetical protein ALC60_09246 [Trachymyrmex zeteki]